MRSATLRLVVIALLSFAFGIPLVAVYAVVSERQGYGEQARRDIAAAWSGPQTVAGPALVAVVECDYLDADRRRQHGRWSTVTLPELFEGRGEVTTERRSRGIFEALIYRASIELKGELELAPPAAPDEPCVGPRRVEAWIAFGVSDPRGVDELTPLRIDGVEHPWQIGTGLSGAWANGARTPVELPPAGAPGRRVEFATRLVLRGSERIDLLPVGRETRAALVADWPSPSFQGAYLPERREVRADGFSADWRVSALARTFPSSWRGSDPPHGLSEAAFGVALLLPVDGYQRTERALKYGLLVVVLTFLAFFLFELGSDLQLHVVQYGLVGAALCVFYLLLLSLSEHLGFGSAYAAAAAATVGLIAAYASAILRGGRRAAAFAGLLVALYGGLYALLVTEDLALLVGSLALFAVLALLMWRTRHVDWRRPLVEGPRSAAGVSPASGGGSL